MQFAGMGRMMWPRSGGGAPAPAGFDPATLFASGEDGLFYDPSDLSTLFQDTAGTTPVTTDGDPVARIDDKSGNSTNGLQTTNTKRPPYKESGGLSWLAPDGVDDGFNISNLDLAPAAGSQTWTICFAADSNGDTTYSWGSDLVSNASYPLLAKDGSASSALVGPGMTLNSLVVDGITGSPTTRDDIHTLLDGLHVGRIEFVVPSTKTWDNPLLFLFTVGGADNYSGLVYSVIYINRALTEDEKTDVDAYLASKSGVTL